MKPEFVHLRVHSEFSLVDGIVKIKPLVNKLVSFNMPAAALTEQSNLFSLVKFYRATLAQGVKPIVGSDVYIYNQADPEKPFRLTLIARNNKGYVTLTELISKAYQEGQYQDVPMIKKEWIEVNHQGLIAMSAAMEGDIGIALLADKNKEAEQLAVYWMSIFDQYFYLEIQRVGKSEEERYINAAVNLALKLDLPVVATNDVRFMDKSDFDSHEVRVCINQSVVLDDTRRPKNYTNQQYLRSTEEMLELFSDIPEALENTIEIAKRCNVELTLGKNYLPDFPVPDGMTLDEFFIDASQKGLDERLQQYPATGEGTEEDNRKVYTDRLELELGVITQMGFPGYFMIVADFIQWAKNQAIPVGPGRGSGAGSLVAYVLKITDLDPIEFDLLFERFLNPERVSMPDFDIDFCMDRRDEVIDYVARYYGRDHVSQIITYGSMAAKAVIRDVGRVSSFGYGFVDSLAKLVPFEIGMTLTRALQESPDLKKRYESEDDVKSLIDMALSLEGISRNAGKHAGGVVISPTKLTDFSPLYCEEGGGNLVTQFDKDDVEAVGLVKFDFLGLRTLTIIDWALQTVNAKKTQLNEPLVDITQIPRDDQTTFDEIFIKCQTTAVFQLESRGMKELIRKLKPDCFDDIIALVALFRPGPLESGMVDDYINVKHGAKAEYAHSLLVPILSPTNGVILYQEQVMQIARELAGYTLGGADMLRRAMGKKKPEEMAKQRTIFTEGAINNKIDESIATYVFDLMEKFAGYGFNKSHSAAYALVAYQTAWLKRHYPAAFMAAVMSSDMDNTDKVVILIEECKEMELTLYSPDINLSHYKFTVNDQNEIIYGIGAIKGVGEAAIEDLIAEREKNGLYKGLYDLCKRVELRKVNKRVLEALIKGGAFDSIDDNRAAHLAELPTVLRVADQHGKMSQTGQNDMFGLAVNVDKSDDSEAYATSVEPWSEKEKLEAEKVTLGLFLTGHPIELYESELKHIRNASIGSLLADAERSKSKMEARVVGLVVEMRTRQTKKGTMMGFATLDDKTGRLEIAAFSKTFEAYKHILLKDTILVVEGAIESNDFSGGFSLRADKLYTFEEAREMYARGIIINLDGFENKLSEKAFIEGLKNTVQPFSGGNCPIQLGYRSVEARAILQLGDEWRVHPTDEFILSLKKFFTEETVGVKYR
ncbi:MAG: DNA polymerase III subunit alpha [Methylococcales bacterium]|nr:DNA polymerase III subunit alpha [Methylococcales bacterium]